MLKLNHDICFRCFMKTQKRFILEDEAKRYFEKCWKKQKLPACCYSQPNNAFLVDIICLNRIPKTCPYILEQTVNLSKIKRR